MNNSIPWMWIMLAIVGLSLLAHGMWSGDTEEIVSGLIILVVVLWRLVVLVVK